MEKKATKSTSGCSWVGTRLEIAENLEKQERLNRKVVYEKDKHFHVYITLKNPLRLNSDRNEWFDKSWEPVLAADTEGLFAEWESEGYKLLDRFNKGQPGKRTDLLPEARAGSKRGRSSPVPAIASAARPRSRASHSQVVETQITTRLQMTSPTREKLEILESHYSPEEPPALPALIGARAHAAAAVCRACCCQVGFDSRRMTSRASDELPSRMQPSPTTSRLDISRPRARRRPDEVSEAGQSRVSSGTGGLSTVTGITRASKTSDSWIGRSYAA